MTRISLLLGLLAFLAAPAASHAQGKEEGGDLKILAKKKKPPEVVELEKILASFDRAAKGPDASALAGIDDQLVAILRRDLAKGRSEIRRAKKAAGSDETAEQKKERRAVRRAYIERRRIALRLGTLRGKTDAAALQKKRSFIVRLLEMANEEARSDEVKKKANK